MKFIQSPSFKRTYKKLPIAQRLLVNEALDAILADAAIGTLKTGDLSGVRVHKFRIAHQLTLLAYREMGEEIELLYLGPHENFYRDLKH